MTKSLAVSMIALAALALPKTASAQFQLSSEPAAPRGGTTTELRTPPRVEPTDSYGGLLMTLIVGVCVAAAVGAVIIPSQRTHQD